MRAHIVTLFPESFESYFSSSIIRIAREKGLFDVQYYHLSEFSSRDDGRVDDASYGGGPGQVLCIEPLVRAIRHIESHIGSGCPKIFLSPHGKSLKQSDLEHCADIFVDADIIIMCGHYEGVDARVFELFSFQQFSLGDYVVSSGEVAAMVFLDGIIRLLPGVLGNPDSVQQDSFSPLFGGKKEYPQYTRPQVFEGYSVPDILTSGNHADIALWREQNLGE